MAKSRKVLDGELTGDKEIKKPCGHVEGYRCCCKGEREHTYDLVTEMKMARRTGRNDAIRQDIE